ncbi:unnamed protein product [Phaeothamnion confervicola]
MSRLSVPLLKSMLQKNVRRCRAEPAARCALELMLKSYRDFIRRISVIMLEDAMLHPAAPLFAWLTAAGSKGFSPPPVVVAACLSAVYEMASCPFKDHLCEDGNAVAGSAAAAFPSTAEAAAVNEATAMAAATAMAEASKGNRAAAVLIPEAAASPASGAAARVGGDAAAAAPARTTDAGEAVESEMNTAASAVSPRASQLLEAPRPREAARLGPAGGTLCRALAIRVGYGGMTCDVKMMETASALWRRRFSEDTSPPPPLSAPGAAALVSSAAAVAAAAAGAAGAAEVGGAAAVPTGAASCDSAVAALAAASAAPLAYVHSSLDAQLRSQAWLRITREALAGCGIPLATLATLMRHVHGFSAPTSAFADDATTAAASSCCWPPSLGSTMPSLSQPLPSQQQQVAEVALLAAPLRAAKPRRPPLPPPPILSAVDAIPAGCDFHVSSVMEEVLKKPGLTAAVRTELALARAAAGSPLPWRSVGAADDVGGALRNAMWLFRSGVNVRRPLVLPPLPSSSLPPSPPPSFPSSSQSLTPLPGYEPGADVFGSSGAYEAASGAYAAADAEKGRQLLRGAWRLVERAVEAYSLNTILPRLCAAQGAAGNR